ncbi:Ig-like domain-containing protein [Bacillus thuringiensis]|nr:Ig-like domain-containing protein [Bacillus thuringiensis]
MDFWIDKKGTFTIGNIPVNIPEAPNVQEVKDTDTKVTGTAMKDADITVKAGGTEIGKGKVDGNGTYSIDISPQTAETILSVTASNSAGTSNATETIVKDGTNWDTWSIVDPTFNEVTDQDRNVTGYIPAQSIDYNRTYELQVKLNGKTIKTESVTSDTEYDIRLSDDVILKENDEVTVQLIGKQENREDKVSNEITQKVKDGTGWSDWEVKEASVNDLYESDQKIKGHVPEQDTGHDRNYQLVVSVNGTEAGKFDVAVNADYEILLPENIHLKKDDSVEVKMIGKQEGKDDKESGVMSTIVQTKTFPTTSKFELGYWQNYGLVYEGRIDNEGWNLSDVSRISKEVQVLNENGEVVKTIPAATTDWYEKDKYNGYQFIVDNDTLGSLPEGMYILRMQVKIDGSVVGETDLELERQFSRMGPMHNKYADLEKVVVLGNIVSPVVINNHPGMSISKNEKEAVIQLFNKYWNQAEQLVYEGYLNTEESLQEITKKLTIRDNENNVVYEKEGLPTASDLWSIPTNVPDEYTFQAIIPNEFSNQQQYQYTISIVNSEGNEIVSEPLN